MDNINTQQASLVSIQRYPVKGMAGCTMAMANLTKGQTLARDRAYGIEIKRRDISVLDGEWMQKSRFVQLVNSDALAALTVEFDDDGEMLKILRNGKKVAQGSLQSKIGRDLISQFMAAYLGESLPGTPHVTAANSHYSDCQEAYLSIINLNTVADIARVAGHDLDEARFRGNLIVDGLEAWAELEWVGQTLAIDGKPALEVVEAISRCAAICVEPGSGMRDMHVLHILENTFGHGSCGLYAKVISDVTLQPGQTISLVKPD